MRRRACIVVASEMTVRVFLLRQIAAMQEHFEVTVVLNGPTPELVRVLGGSVQVRSIPIERKISPVSDLTSLFTLLRIMRAGSFDLVHSMTPKAGLLAMVAAWLARVPVRLHTFTGQVWVTRRGVQRLALKLFDRVVAGAATLTFADSASQRAFLVMERIAPASKIALPGKGSVSGVDASRFRPDPEVRRVVRDTLGIAGADTLLLFVGRVTRDKGVLDLARAFRVVADRRSDVHLLIVGPDEDQLSGAMADLCGPHRARLHFCGYTPVPERYMAASDILCLPSYREGFGSVAIEAAAAGVPAVASRIYGIVDAVIDGTTGLLYAPGDIDGLAERIECLADPDRRAVMGAAARRRAVSDFSQDAVTAAVLQTYAGLLANADPQTTVRESARSPSGGWYPRYGKRLFDVAAAGLGIVLLLPIVIGVAVLVRCTLGSPVLFRQRRPGLHGVPFTLVKFRSMTLERDVNGALLPDADRLTAVGRFLRASSLDEIPQLWNVLTGDMSVVGPRPLLMEYLTRYSPRQARRHAVRPGITGLAQVNGRNELSWPRRFDLDVQYVERCSLALDLEILARTAILAISGRGISQRGRATVDLFEGNVADHG
jgi:lipopolysaccharide/colanic/teichoic acid biosynthesis glycosyltransferase/glycosyltransferase involved in cell wall biosynthesis